VNKLKRMFKSFDLIGEDQGLFTAIVLSVAFGLMIAFYISAEDSKKTNVVQTPETCCSQCSQTQLNPRGIL
jgi:lipopolysaccharide export system protein LptC